MDIIKAHCNKCCGTRRHEVLHKEKTDWSEAYEDGQFTIYGGYTYSMIKCCGCENIALKHDSWCSEETDINGSPLTSTIYFPPATYREKPRWLSEFLFLSLKHSFVGELITEIYIALQNNSSRLAVMGVRSLIEQVMIDKIGDKGTFKNNLDEFERRGFISKTQKEILEPVLDAGHAAIHRNYKPSMKDVVSLIDIVENIIESLYVNSRRALNIKKKIPLRQQEHK